MHFDNIISHLNYNANGSMKLSHSSPTHYVPELNNDMMSGKKYKNARSRVEAAIQRYQKSGSKKRMEVKAAMY